MAVFNVTPHKAGSYFNKIECFCFTGAAAQAGRDAELPVVFFIDPAIDDDPDLKKLTTITLSYTFYPAGKVPVEAAGRAVGKSKRTERSTAMADTHAKHHDYHLVDPSPWPAVGATGAFIMAIGAINWMHSIVADLGHARRHGRSCSTPCSCGGAT